MAQSKAAASRSKSTAARAERNGKPKQITWRGLDFTLPAKLPGTLMWDFAGAREDPVTATIGTIQRVLGDDQSAKVRQKIADDEITMDEVLEPLTELLESIFGAYGATAGE